MELTFHDLRILLKAATGYHIEDESDYEKQGLIDGGLLIKSGAGYYDVSSTVNQKLDRVIAVWEEL